MKNTNPFYITNIKYNSQDMDKSFVLYFKAQIQIARAKGIDYLLSKFYNEIISSCRKNKSALKQFEILFQKCSPYFNKFENNKDVKGIIDLMFDLNISMYSKFGLEFTDNVFKQNSKLELNSYNNVCESFDQLNEGGTAGQTTQAFKTFLNANSNMARSMNAVQNFRRGMNAQLAHTPGLAAKKDLVATTRRTFGRNTQGSVTNGVMGAKGLHAHYQNMSQISNPANQAAEAKQLQIRRLKPGVKNALPMYGE